MSDSLPELPSWNNLKVFALGLLWAVVSGMGAAFLLIIDDLARWGKYQDAIDWPQTWHLAIGLGALGARGYYLKHKALLSPPPGQDPDAAAFRKAAGGAN